MNFDYLTWFLVIAIVGFALGWLASRMDLRQLRTENRESPKAYFKGLNLLLNEQQDAAIDSFIEAVQNDPDTSELHFALGNLFRRRGDYERAVRVHQHLIARGDLNQSERARAQHALAQDYLKAGLLNFAEDALIKLQGSSYEQEAQQSLLSIYERARDWPKAGQVALELEKQGLGSFASRRAHFLCEEALANPDPQIAEKQLRQAIEQAPEHERARIELAQLYFDQNQAEKAFTVLSELAQTKVQSMPLAAKLLAKIAQTLHREADGLALLRDNYANTHSIDVLEAIIQLEADAKLESEHYSAHLREEDSLIAASHWLKSHIQNADVQRSVDNAAKPLMRYRCAACGFSSHTHFWQCPACLNWDSFPAKRVEEL